MVKDTLGGCLEFNFLDSVEREKEVNWLSRIKNMTVERRDTDVRGIETKARKNGGGGYNDRKCSPLQSRKKCFIHAEAVDARHDRTEDCKKRDECITLQSSKHH